MADETEVAALDAAAVDTSKDTETPDVTESEVVDKAGLKKLQERAQKVNRDNIGLKQSLAELTAKFNQIAAKELSDLDRAKNEAAESKQKQAEAEARASLAERKLSMAAVGIDPEYLEIVASKIEQEEKSDPLFDRDQYLKNLKAKKPALFSQIANQAPGTGSGVNGNKPNTAEAKRAELTEAFKNAKSFEDKAKFRLMLQRLG